MASSRNILHEHENFVNPSNILLHFSNVVLQDRSFDTFSRFEPLHHASVFIPNVSLNDLFHSFDFVETVVKSDNLADKLGPFWHQTLMNLLVHLVKSVTEGLFDVANSVQLRIVGTHHCAIVTEQLFAGVTKVAQWLIVKKTALFLDNMGIQNGLHPEGTFRLHTASRVETTWQICAHFVQVSHVGERGSPLVHDVCIKLRFELTFDVELRRSR